jgi:hypothetical protein
MGRGEIEGVAREPEYPIFGQKSDPENRGKRLWAVETGHYC